MAILFSIAGTILWLGIICRTAADCSTSTQGVNTFGSECQYMCHCTDGASCDTTTGECTYGCDTNWFGPACQQRDLAEAQYSRHTSNQRAPHYSVEANDGNTSTCSYTQKSDRSKKKQWWRVWFPQNETIRDIYIQTLDTHLQYFRSFNVTVEYVPENEEENNTYVPTNVQTCYQHSYTIPESRYIQVHCDPPLVGNQVRIKLSSVQSQLVLCDVRIGAGRNIAFRKYTTSNGYTNNYSPDYAVDGRFGTASSTDWTGCFAASDAGNYKYLDINLGTSIYTYSVNIDAKSEDYIRDYKIYTSPTSQAELQLVYDDTGNIPPVTYVHIDANVQQLRIQTNSANQLGICELQIYGECDESKWGSQCQHDCGACRVGTCAVVSGECMGGCQDGYQDTNDCKSECDDGKYGIGCTQKCVPRCANTCDNVNGHCSQCPPGWKGNFCETQCIDGRYGINCEHECSDHCVDLCNKYNGSCSCSTGRQGHTCHDECPEGTYGVNCNQSCSTNCEDICDHVHGTCTTCKAGWKGDNCDSECDDGKYGIGCTQVCVPLCANTCDKVTGHCLQCPSGWKGDFCETECSIGQYGINCAGSCGFCTVHTSCDTVTGVCPSGCMDGYTGATCKQDIKQSLQSTTIGIIAGSVVAGIVVICVTIVVLYRRRQSPPVITEPENRVEMSHAPTSASYEDLQQNVYMNGKEETNYETINLE